MPAIGAHRLSIAPLVLAICLTLTHCRSVISPCLSLPPSSRSLASFVTLMQKRKRKNTTKKNVKRKRYMKIFITRQKRKQAANPKQKQKPKPKPNPKTYFEFCTSAGLSVACQACQPAPPSPRAPCSPACGLRNALPIVSIYSYSGNCSRCRPQGAPCSLLSLQSHLTFLRVRFVSFRN